jgi:hypothetical protein
MADQPNNVFQRLLVWDGGRPIEFIAGEPLPGTNDKDSIWAIFFDPGTVDTDEAGFATTEPARYLLFMESVRAALVAQKPGERVTVHEVLADKVLLATRVLAASDALEELESLIGKETVGDMVRGAQQQPRLHAVPPAPAG